VHLIGGPDDVLRLGRRVDREDRGLLDRVEVAADCLAVLSQNAELVLGFGPGEEVAGVRDWATSRRVFFSPPPPIIRYGCGRCRVCGEFRVRPSL
jgi:hypothetical protein